MSLWFRIKMFFRRRSIIGLLSSLFSILLTAFLVLSMLSWFLMLLWNHTLTSIFQLPQITFWQSMGLLIFCQILFNTPSDIVKFEE